MFGNYIKSMPKLNDAEERKKKSLKPGPAQVNHKYTRGPSSSGKSSSSTRCQKCENFGHYTYNCPVAHAPYKARPSRTQQLLNPKPLRNGPSVEVPEEFLTKEGIAEKILANNELERQAQSKLAAPKSSKKKTKPKTSSDSSASTSNGSDSTSDSDSDSDSDSNSISSTTSSSSSGDSSDSSSVSDPGGSSSPASRRVKRRPSSKSGSSKSPIPSRRYRHRSRSVSRKPIGSKTSPSPRARDSPHRSHAHVRSLRPSAESYAAHGSRRAASPYSRSPRRITSRSNPRIEINDYSRDREQKTFPIKSSAPPRRHHGRSRSASRESARSRTPPSPRLGYSPHDSHRPRHAIGSRVSLSQRRGSGFDSRSPRRKVRRPNSGYDSRGSSRERSRQTIAAEITITPRAYRHRTRSITRESVGSRASPSRRRRHSPHHSDRRARSPRLRAESQASFSPRRDATYTSRSRKKVIPPESEHGSRGSSRDRHRKIEPIKSPVSPRRHRPRPRSVSRESLRSRAPSSPKRRYSPHRSHKRGRSPAHSAGSRTPPSPGHSHRSPSRSPRRKASRPSHERDSRGSVRARR